MSMLCAKTLWGKNLYLSDDCVTMPFNLGCDFDLKIFPNEDPVGRPEAVVCMRSWRYFPDSTGALRALKPGAKKVICMKKSERSPTMAKMQNRWIPGTNVNRPNVKMVT